MCNYITLYNDYYKSFKKVLPSGYSNNLNILTEFFFVEFWEVFVFSGFKSFNKVMSLKIISVWHNF